jgi:hypothetical protein
MVLGVDVTHGLTGSKKPSVAAVVGSHDPACTRYAAAVSEQTAGHEVVLGMQESVGVLLAGYRARRGQLPEAILVFRDGVSDSMYGAVVQHEVAAIRAACEEMAAGGGKSKAKVRPSQLAVLTNMVCYEPEREFEPQFEPQLQPGYLCFGEPATRLCISVWSDQSAIYARHGVLRCGWRQTPGLLC